MNTFLPYPSFRDSVMCLDYRRLGKQRVEAMQIYDIITGNKKSNAWRNHPAVLMWQGYHIALGWYINEAIYEWVRRGFKNTMKMYPFIINYQMPFWIGDEKFHNSHKSNLLRKNPSWYSKFNWQVDKNLPYIWPCHRVQSDV